MSDGPPVWLLDIDGVINADENADAWHSADWIDRRVRFGHGRVRVFAARPVLDFIRHVHANGLADIRYHTTWQHDAHHLGAVFGLPRLPVQDAAEYAHGGRLTTWWKLPVVWRLIAAGHRVVWTDDDIEASLMDAQKLRLEDAGALIVSPDPTTGLRQTDLDKIATYLDDVGA